jgi:hypothetical protein
MAEAPKVQLSPHHLNQQFAMLLHKFRENLPNFKIEACEIFFKNCLNQIPYLFKSL